MTCLLKTLGTHCTNSYHLSKTEYTQHPSHHHDVPFENPSKCATLGWKRGEKLQQPDPVQLKLHNEVLPVVKLGEAYKYLGVKDALESSVHQNQILRGMSKAEDITKLLRSALLPWQKLDAIRTFVMSRLDYHLRHCYPYRQQLIVFDRHIRSALKATFKLSKSTIVEMLHRPTSHGGHGCTSLITIATATQIGHAVQMLNSSDSVIQAVAEGQLLEVIKKASICTRESDKSEREAILAYLNGRDLGCLKRRGKRVDVRSLRSELPGSLSMNKTRIETGRNESYVVQRTDGSELDQKHITKKDPETLAHVLNHCPHHMDSKIKDRHNKALERFATAIKSSAKNRGKKLQIDALP
ncbi:hypothetical protein EPH_0055280 [Eimeria praecox]|uniref:Uncharacterized protein n=1 Tax=Eimeria praecox TaxID=51316 RepID=U6GVX6_9EIME|nr:hypothetical protein EPH_0055280 [Eimeria praecox]